MINSMLANPEQVKYLVVLSVLLVVLFMTWFIPAIVEWKNRQHRRELRKQELESVLNTATLLVPFKCYTQAVAFEEQLKRGKL